METETALRLPQSLLQQVRVKAVREGISLSEVTRRLLRSWLKGQVETKPVAHRRQQVAARLAREAFGMWSDRDPDEYLAHSRVRLAFRDQEVEDARMGI